MSTNYLLSICICVVGNLHNNTGLLFKQVLRQTTLPSVPTRHQTFQRQLSHRLDFENVQFSVCRLEPRNEVGIIKVTRHLFVNGLEQRGSGLWQSRDSSYLPALLRSRRPAHTKILNFCSKSMRRQSSLLFFS